MSNLPELSAAYIASITEEELRAAGYEVKEGYSLGWSRAATGVSVGKKFLTWVHNDVQGWNFAREHYAPRKALAEAQARNAALEALVREASVAYDAFSHDFSVIMPIDWCKRAAKLLEVGE